MMEIIIHTPDLKKALAFLKPFIPARSPKPILRCVLMDAVDGMVKMTATILDAWAECSILAATDGSGKLLIPFNALLSACNMADLTLAISGDNEKAILKWGNGQAETEAFDPAEFPMHPPAGEAVGSIEAKMVSSMLAEVAPFVAKAHPHYAMSGINLTSGRGQLAAIATDDFRLAIIAGKAEYAAGLANLQDFNVILPANAGKLLGMLEGKVILSIDKSEKSNDLVFFHAIDSQRSMSLQLIQGNFPKWKDVVPDEEKLKIRVEVDGKDMAEKLRRLPVDQETYGEPRVSLAIRPESIELSNGKAIMAVPASSNGKIDIRFNPKYLADGLAFAGESATIAINTPLKSVKITPTGNAAKRGFFRGTKQDRTYILMLVGDE
jgi:DNA polymerase-3 subunit beta